MSLKRIKIFSLVGIIICLISSCASTDKKWPNELGSMGFVGEIDKTKLLSNFPLFNRHFEDYQPDKNEINQINKLDGSEMVIFFGVWCPDSQREVGRFLKILQESPQTFSSLKMIAVDFKKTVPAEYQNQFEVKYTPTFFLLKEGKIVAKVIEKPEAGLIYDLVNQL
ncbi:MAG: thioredoxin domain-containing protein [Gammaproteobacteria bacterium]|nr:thioredoxin domain-containing protein [Gammaproteobacteria bacterium]MDH5630121.1 thioredoxin domain-containing protein [Gammaproteobacteria bacterium]